MKRIIYLLPMLLLVASCSIFQKKGTNTDTTNLTEQLILGKWTVKTITIGDRTIGQEVFGKDASMDFQGNGEVVVDLPQQTIERSYYQIIDNKIIDPNNPNEYMEIVSITDSKLQIKLITEGQDPVIMEMRK